MKAISIVVAVLALAVAGGAGYQLLQKTRALEAAERELAEAQGEARKARAAEAAAKSDAAAARAELAEQKAQADKLRSEVAAAASFLDAEKAVSARLREDLALAKEKLALMASRNQPGPPMLIRAVPSRVEAIRIAPGGTARSAASPAAPAPEGYVPPR